MGPPDPFFMGKLPFEKSAGTINPPPSLGLTFISIGKILRTNIP